VRLLVVGEPGSGKTTWCRDYLACRRKGGARVGGILCTAIEQHGQRIGCNALDLLTGQEVPFARLSSHGWFKEGEGVGEYSISKGGILFACGAIERAVESRCDLVIVDEVGPLELHGRGLVPAVELALASAVDVLIVVRSRLKEALKRRFSNYEFVVLADLTPSPSNVSEAARRKAQPVPTCESPTESPQPQDGQQT